LAIPEPILVPLGVVQHLFPEWLEDDAFWHDPATFIEARQTVEQIKEGIAALRSEGSIDRYRRAFAHITSGVHIVGAGIKATTPASTPLAWSR
jgi:hypothetical protein